MATQVTIQMFGDWFFRREIRKMAYRAIDMAPVLRDIGDDMQQIIEEQFETEGARGGHKWAELRFDTISKRGSAHPILVDSGDLLIEMTGPDNIEVTHDSVTVTLPEGALQKAEAAQYGFHARDGEFIKPRPLVSFTEFDRMGFRDKMTDFLVHGDRSQ